MIVIKTRMHRIPPCCQKCVLYIPGNMFGDGCCCAALYVNGWPKSLYSVIVTKSRADFCPLVEIEKVGKKQNRR